MRPLEVENKRVVWPMTDSSFMGKELILSKYGLNMSVKCKLPEKWEPQGSAFAGLPGCSNVVWDLGCSP